MSLLHSAGAVGQYEVQKRCCWSAKILASPGFRRNAIDCAVRSLDSESDGVTGESPHEICSEDAGRGKCLLDALTQSREAVRERNGQAD
jgi:hypothetical protein